MTTHDLELTVEGMHCNNCGLLIDETVEDLDGVARCATDTRRGTTRVTFDPSRVTIADIVAAVGDAGYTATSVETQA